MRVHTGHHHDPIGYGLGLMATKCAHQVDGWMDGRTPLEPFYYLTFQLSSAKNDLVEKNYEKVFKKNPI
jgi:hypothetical protein